VQGMIRRSPWCLRAITHSCPQQTHVDMKSKLAARWHTVSAFIKVKEINELPLFDNNAHVVAFGSQVSNIFVRDVMGNPYSDHPISQVPVQRSDQKGVVKLRWNLIADRNAPTQTRLQYGVNWEFKPHIFRDFLRGDQIYPIDLANSDILLITALPRNPTGSARAIIFSGLHGAATKAAILLLDDPPIEERNGTLLDY
jgi:hypothetical protein